MKEKKAFMALTIGIVILTAFLVAVGSVGIYGISNNNHAVDSFYYQNVAATNAIREISEILHNQLAKQRDYVVFAGDSVKIQEVHNELIDLEKAIAHQFTLYEGTIMDMTEEQDYFNAKSLYLNEFSEVKEDIQQAALIGFEAGFNELTAPRTMYVTTEMLSRFEKCKQMNDAWAEEWVYSESDSSTTMIMLMITLIAFSVSIALIMVIVSVIFARKIGKSQSGDTSMSFSDTEKAENISDELKKTIETL